MYATIVRGLFDERKRLRPMIGILFKHLSLLTEKLEIKVQGDLVARLKKGRKRVVTASGRP